MLEYVKTCTIEEAAAISEALYELSDILRIVNSVNPMSPEATEIFIRELAIKAGARVNELLEEEEKKEAKRKLQLNSLYGVFATEVL